MNKNINKNNERIMTLNDKGIILLIVVVLCTTFACGWLASSKNQEQNVTVFTQEDLDRISKMQTAEKIRLSGAQVFAYKDKEGRLVVGWDYGDN